MESTPNPKLLIIDDSKFARMTLIKYLQAAQPDWVIHEAAGVDEALAITRDIQPDFFTVDLNMPERDGFEFIEEVRSDDPKARMVLLTANIQVATEERAKELSVPWVAKPVTEQSVQQLIEGLLQ